MAIDKYDASEIQETQTLALKALPQKVVVVLSSQSKFERFAHIGGSDGYRSRHVADIG